MQTKMQVACALINILHEKKYVQGFTDSCNFPACANAVCEAREMLTWCVCGGGGWGEMVMRQCNKSNHKTCIKAISVTVTSIDRYDKQTPE